MGAKLKFKKTVITLLVLSAGLANVQAASEHEADEQEENPHLWKPRVESVAVFKNGLGFFTGRGDVNLRDGWCVTSEVPPAAFGTFAIYSLDNDHVVDIVGSGPGEIVDFDDKDAPKNIVSKRHRLESSRNLKVQLTYKHKGANRTAAGRITSVGPEYVILQTQDNSFAVPIKVVSRMQILDLPIRVHVNSEDQKPPKKTNLGMAYLRKGITWIPEYTVKVLNQTTAELTLRGTLINEAEDLTHCDVHFVVGVPHFLHTDYMAPIAVGQAIRTIGTAIAPQQVMTQIMNRAAIVDNTYASDQFGRSPDVIERIVSDRSRNVDEILGNIPRIEGPAGTDYTVYTKKDITLRRGEKAIVTLFVKKISYSHVYRWSPPERMKHFLVLHNDTDTAWTTGPYLAVSHQRPLSEDLLKYTPKSGKCEIPVTQAVNIAHDKSEAEIDRKLKDHSPRRDKYLDFVTLEGTIKLKNFEKKPADIIIGVSVPGKPTYASDDGVLQADPTKLMLTERTGNVHWKIRLEQGETKTLTYKYERYVPSD